MAVSFKTFKNLPGSERKHYMVIGSPVSHSLSPVMHNAALKYYGYKAAYYAVELKENELGEFTAWMNKDSFSGCNITIPYKRAMMEMVDQIDPSASEIGAINTIIKKKGSLIGYNTDAIGFQKPLQKFSDIIDGGRAVIFGTGGASNAVVYALKSMNCAEIILISRNPAIKPKEEIFDSCMIAGYDQWTAFAEEASLIVNATPLGMEPDIESAPVRDGEEIYLSGSLCYDLVYRPAVTKFLKQAESAGSETIGGLEMLIHQGSESFRLWTGQPFPIHFVKKQLLTGMKKKA